MNVRSVITLALLSSTALVGLTVAGGAQVQGKVGQYSDAKISGLGAGTGEDHHCRRHRTGGEAQGTRGLQGRGLCPRSVNPRMLAISDAGVLYATRRSVGDVVMLNDENGDGKAAA